MKKINMLCQKSKIGLYIVFFTLDSFFSQFNFYLIWQQLLSIVVFSSRLNVLVCRTASVVKRGY